jgi:hypothetical protein
MLLPARLPMDRPPRRRSASARGECETLQRAALLEAATNERCPAISVIGPPRSAPRTVTVSAAAVKRSAERAGVGIVSHLPCRRLTGPWASRGSPGLPHALPGLELSRSMSQSATCVGVQQPLPAPRAPGTCWRQAKRTAQNPCPVGHLPGRRAEEGNVPVTATAQVSGGTARARATRRVERIRRLAPSPDS